MSKLKLKVAFQMDDINNINLNSDTTFALIVEAYKRNFDLYYYNPKNLSVTNNKVLAKAHKIIKADYINSNHVKLEQEELLDLGSMNVIWLRQDPPFDMSYLTSTYFLEYLVNTNPNILVINNPKEVRNYPEKIAAHYFSEFMPQTLITKDKNLILSFLEKEKKLIIKPLYDAKGNGIFLLEQTHPNTEALIDNFLTTYKEPVIVQQFLEKISLGDKRVLIVDGEALGVFKRVPQNGITSNLAKGGLAETANLTTKEQKICQAVGSYLKQHDLFFAGIDLIDGHLTAINLTSPTGRMNYYQYSGGKLAITI